MKAFAIIRALTTLYASAAATTLLFVALARSHARLVNSEAWTHAVIVFVFAIVLLVVVRKTGKGSRRAYKRLQIISIVIPAASILLVAIPGLPNWMKVEQGASALMLAAVAFLARHPTLRVADNPEPERVSRNR